MTFKKLLISIFTLMTFCQTSQAIDPRAKALGAMALYGTVGGTLLGTASLAFGSSGRSVAKGASLGLYAGILFGSYIVISHAYRKHRSEHPEAQENFYPGVQGPYEQGTGGGSQYDEPAPGGYRWQPVLEMEYEAEKQRAERIRPFQNNSSKFEFFLPVFNYSF